VIEKEIVGHMANCALHKDGPCTCGTDEILEELAFEAAELVEEDFQ